jgi:predicted DNA-binding transcriptional regulator AlpA
MSPTLPHELDEINYSPGVAELIDPDDLLDAEAVADLLGLASSSVISVYRKRYEDFPKPRVEKGRCRLWLRGDVEGWTAKQP